MTYKFLEKPYNSIAELNAAIAAFWLSDWPPRRRAMLAESTDAGIADEIAESFNLDGRRPVQYSYEPHALDGYDRTWLINAIRMLRAKQTEADNVERTIQVSRVYHAIIAKIEEARIAGKWSYVGESSTATNAIACFGDANSDNLDDEGYRMLDESLTGFLKEMRQRTALYA